MTQTNLENKKEAEATIRKTKAGKYYDLSKHSLVRKGKKELTHEELNTYLTNIDKNIESYQNDKDVKKEKDKLTSKTFSGLKFRSIGPAFTSGRIADFAVNPNNHSEYYGQCPSQRHHKH